VGDNQLVAVLGGDLISGIRGPGCRLIQTVLGQRSDAD